MTGCPHCVGARYYGPADIVRTDGVVVRYVECRTCQRLVLLEEWEDAQPSPSMDYTRKVNAPRSCRCRGDGHDHLGDGAA